MSAGLFALSCPQCNGELEIDHRGMGSCPRCERAYLNRFGHLIPIEHHDRHAPAADATAFGPGGVVRGGA